MNFESDPNSRDELSQGPVASLTSVHSSLAYECPGCILPRPARGGRDDRALRSLSLHLATIMRHLLRAPTLAGLVIAVGCTKANTTPNRVPTPQTSRRESDASNGHDSTSGRRRTAAGGRTRAGAGRPPPDPVPRPYNRVITPVAKTRAGLFKTHRIGSRLLFEVPPNVMNKDILMVRGWRRHRLVAHTVASRSVGRRSSAGSVATIACCSVRFATTLSPTRATRSHGAVAASTFAPVIASFNVDAYGPDSAGRHRRHATVHRAACRVRRRCDAPGHSGSDPLADRPRRGVSRRTSRSRRS